MVAKHVIAVASLALSGFWTLNRPPTMDRAVDWRPQIVAVDIDCDGHLDEATVGKSPGSVLVRVRFARGHDPAVLEFPVDRVQQAAVCSDNITLQPEGLDFDPKEMVGALDGFTRSTTCMGLRLDDGECDSIHIYWNRTKKRLDWWRL